MRLWRNHIYQYKPLHVVFIQGLSACAETLLHKLFYPCCNKRWLRCSKRNIYWIEKVSISGSRAPHPETAWTPKVTCLVLHISHRAAAPAHTGRAVTAAEQFISLNETYSSVLSSTTKIKWIRKTGEVQLKTAFFGALCQLPYTQTRFHGNWQQRHFMFLHPTPKTKQNTQIFSTQHKTFSLLQ